MRREVRRDGRREVRRDGRMESIMLQDVGMLLK